MQRLHDDDRLGVGWLVDDPALQGLVRLIMWKVGLPETYQYVASDSDLDILHRAHALMQQHWRQRGVTNSTTLNGPDEALILASIVERNLGSGRRRGSLRCFPDAWSKTCVCRLIQPSFMDWVMALMAI